MIITAVEEEFRISHTRAVFAVSLLLLLLGVPSALSFSPIELTVAGMPFLNFMDQFGGTNIVIISGVVGAGLFCWLIPRERIHYSLAATSRWWETRSVIVGRSLPFLAVGLLLWQVLL